MFNEQNTVEHYERPIPPAPARPRMGASGGVVAAQSVFIAPLRGASPLIGEIERGQGASHAKS